MDCFMNYCPGRKNESSNVYCCDRFDCGNRVQLTIYYSQSDEETIKKLKAERDAAVKDIKEMLTIASQTSGLAVELCNYCNQSCINNNSSCKPAWRGIQNE